MLVHHKCGSGFLVATLTCLLLATSTANSQEQDPAADGITRISVHTPIWDEYINEDWSGIYGETFKAVFNPAGIEIDLTITPYESSIKQVQKKQADVAMSVYRNEYPGVLYPHWPQELEKAVAVHSKSITYTNEKDLLGKKLAWLRDYHFERYLPKGVEFKEVRTDILGMRMLDRGSIDFFIDYEPTIIKAAEEGGVDLSTLKLSPVTALAKPVYPIFRDDARGQKIMAIYDRRMTELHADGTLDRLFRKYGYDGYAVPPSQSARE